MSAPFPFFSSYHVFSRKKTWNFTLSLLSIRAQARTLVRKAAVKFPKVAFFSATFQIAETIYEEVLPPTNNTERNRKL